MNKQDLKSKIEKLEKGIASKVTPENLKSSLKTQKEKFEKELADLEKKDKSAISEKIKALKDKVKSKKDSISRDGARKAKASGKRIAADGSVYYEKRANRTDSQTKKKPYLEKGGELEGMTANIYRSDYDSPTNKLHGKKSVTIVDSEVPKIFEADAKSPAVKLVRRDIGFGKNEYKYIHAVPVGIDDHRAMFGGTFIYSSDSRFPAKFPIPLHDRVEGYEKGGDLDMESEEFKKQMIKNHKETAAHYEKMLEKAEKVGQSDWDIEQIKKMVTFHKTMANEYKNDKMAKGGELSNQVDEIADSLVKKLKSKGIDATKRTSKNGVFVYGDKRENGKYKYETYLSYSELPNEEFLELEEFEFLRLHDKMAKGGSLTNEEYDKLTRDYDKLTALYEDAIGEEKKEYAIEIEKLAKKIHKAERGYEKGGYMEDGGETAKFEVDDVVYHKGHNTIGIVRMEESRGEVKTDADGNVNVDELEYYNPMKHESHKNAKIAPSTMKEIEERGLWNPFSERTSKLEKGGFVAVSEKDGYWYIMSKPTSKESAEQLISLGVPRGEQGKVVTIEEAKAHQKVIGGEYLASGGELNVGIRKMAQEEGFTPKELGKEYQLVMGQAVVEALTDANYHSEVKKLISLLENKPEWADDDVNKPEYGTPEYKKWRDSSVYSSEYYDADEKTRDFAIKVSQKAGWDGNAIASAFEYLVRVDGGYHKLADNIKKAMESTDSMADGGEVVLWGVKKGDQDWEEVMITNKPERIEQAKKWAEENGYDRLRVSNIDMNETPDFSKTFAEGGDVNKHTYMMLSRLQMDNEYYLGFGNRNTKRLWAGNVDDQIAEMKKLWNQLPEDGKPEWLSMEDIEEYEKEMKSDKMADGGSISQNIDVFGYTTENFDICPTAIEDFEKAADAISITDSDTKKVALSRAAMYVDDVLGVEKRAKQDNLVSKNELEYAVNQLIVASAYNYASGLEVNLNKFMPMHISTIASMLVSVDESSKKDELTAYDLLLAKDKVGEAAFKNMTIDERKNLAREGKASFEEGGSIEESNYRMVISQAKAIKHHADELLNVLTPDMEVEAWVVGKIERASTDLSDITHYIDGFVPAYIDEEVEDEFEKGGELENGVYYLGKPKKQGIVWAQKVVDIDKDGIYFATDYARKLSDFKASGNVKLSHEDFAKFAKGDKRAKDISVEDFKLEEYATGGMIAGRWYRDNQGVEHRYIGEDASGNSLFSDGEKVSPKSLNEFETKTKESKFLGLFEEGGELKEDFLEDVEELHKEIAEITLVDGSKISHKELMKAHKMAKGGNVKVYEKDEEWRLSRPSGSIEKDILDKVKHTEENFVGNFGWKTSQGKTADGYLYKLNDFDQNLVNDIKLKDGEKIYRYFNRTSAIGGMKPLIKINVNKELLYFLVDTDSDNIVFETRGIQALWIALIGHKMAKGGEIENKFKGKNSKEVWNDLDSSTRAKVLEYLFLKENSGDYQYYEEYNSLNELSYNEWDKLPKNIKNEIERFEKGDKMAKGGKVKFEDKVKAIKASLLKTKKVSPKVQKDYGKTYSAKEAEEAAKRIAGSMRKKEMK